MAPVDTKYYVLLDVSPDASADELKSAYRKMSLRLHPDKGGSPDDFKAMKAAYDVLKDPQKRGLYDAHGPAIVRAMDGEVLEPEVMMQIITSVSKSAGKIVLCSLPFAAVLLLLPTIALSLKWDGEISWNWNIVFIPMWLVQIIALVLVLKLRSVMTQMPDASEEEEDAESRAETEEKKRKVKRVFSIGASLIVLLIIQEVMLAAKLQGYLQASWFIVYAPYLVFELVFLYARVSNAEVPPGSALLALVPAVSWGILRLCTAALLAAKADERLTCSWMLCLLPMMIGASVELVLSCRELPRTPPTEAGEEEKPPGNGFAGACFAVTLWLSMLLLGAGKLDGSAISAFWVFTPLFLITATVLCCCGCLASFGPTVLQEVLEKEQEEREALQQQRTVGLGVNLRASASSSQGYSTMPPDLEKPIAKGDSV